MAIKTLKLDELTQEMCVDREEDQRQGSGVSEETQSQGCVTKGRKCLEKAEMIYCLEKRKTEN